MKTWLITGVGILLFTAGQAQPKNPYNQRGADFVKSWQQIRSDYNAGKIKSLDESTLNFYSRSVPLKNSMNTDLAAQIVKASKTPLNVDELVASTPFTTFTKQTITEFILNPARLDDVSFKDLLEKKLREIQYAEIPENEKELLLTLSAINYSVRDRSTARSGVGGRNDDSPCSVQTIEGTTPVSNDACVTLAAGFGFILGFQVCGIWCGLGGALVFGVIAAVSLS